MISLYDSATLSNTTPFVDTFGSGVIYGNILLYNDSTRSGSSAGRRILKFSPETTIPERRTLTNQLTGEIFILADPEYDSYRGEIIRVKLPALKARASNLLSVNDVLTSSTGTQFHVDVNYLKRTTYEDKSEYDSGVYIYFSNYYDVTYGEVIKVGNSYYKTRSDSRIDELGLHVVEAVRLDSPIQVFSVYVKTGYSPTTDEVIETPYIGVTTFVEPAVIDYINISRSFAKISDGDKLISISKSAVPVLTVGTKIGNYSVISVTDNSDSWSCHCRI